MFSVDKIYQSLDLRVKLAGDFVKIAPRKIFWHLEEELYNLSEKDISAERIKKIRESLSKVAIKLRPIIEGLDPLIKKESDIIEGL